MLREPLTNAQMNKIHHLEAAKLALSRSIAEIKYALGESDVTADYEEQLYGMIKELDHDVEDVWVNG